MIPVAIPMVDRGEDLRAVWGDRSARRVVQRGQDGVPAGLVVDGLVDDRLGEDEPEHVGHESGQRSAQDHTDLHERLPSRSVTGEAEEVPRVVHELVDHHVVAEQRGHA